MHKDYQRKYVLVRTITYVCLSISALSFVLKAYFNSPITLLWWIFGAIIVGIPACLASYYYNGMKGLDDDMSVIGVQTLEKTDEEDPDLGNELTDKTTKTQ
jgi:heme/copper-type cytochrome/quinol oxidase subunit 2